VGAETLAPRLVTLPSGICLEVVERGDPAGLPLVLLHGVTDSWRSFEPLLRLIPPTLRAFALSQRGHGRSSRPRDGYGYADFAEDLRAFLDSMELPRALVVGHSMGSLVAQRFAVDHPERVAGLVLMGAFQTLCGDLGLADFVAAKIEPLRDPISPAFAREWQESTLARAVPEQFLDLVVAETLEVPARVWHAAFGAFLRTPDFSHELARVGAPALVVWGDRDTYASRAQQEGLIAALPRAQLVIYAGAGHALHWEDPVELARQVSAFAERISAEGAARERAQPRSSAR
jgi:pimeloyl-ACP methyl ester carboxylesterase